MMGVGNRRRSGRTRGVGGEGWGEGVGGGGVGGLCPAVGGGGRAGLRLEEKWDRRGVCWCESIVLNSNLRHAQ